jgi:hypothetical protein
MVPFEFERVAVQAAKPASETAPKPPAKPVEEPTQQPAQWEVTRPAEQSPEDTPWWLTEAPKLAETAMIQPRAPRVGTWHSMAANDEPNPAAPEAREKEEAKTEAPTRLNGLRGLLFPLRIKDSGSRKDAKRNDNGNGKGNGNGRAPQADPAAVDPEQTIVIEAVTPQKEHEPVHAKADGTVARGALPRWVTAEPEFLPPRQESADKGKESRAKKTNNDEDDFADIQILPARRGQYRR